MLSEQKIKAIRMAYEGWMSEAIAEKVGISAPTLGGTWGIKVQDIRLRKKQGVRLEEILSEFETKEMRKRADKPPKDVFKFSAWSKTVEQQLSAMDEKLERLITIMQKLDN